MIPILLCLLLIPLEVHMKPAEMLEAFNSNVQKVLFYLEPTNEWAAEQNDTHMSQNASMLDVYKYI